MEFDLDSGSSRSPSAIGKELVRLASAMEATESARLGRDLTPMERINVMAAARSDIMFNRKKSTF
jgi:hypothetical protein